jgi:exportin-1
VCGAGRGGAASDKGFTARPMSAAIKEYIVGLVIKMSTSDETLNAERAFVAKLNQILVEILKQEWPHNWPNFISEIVAASKTNETLCQNNLVILKLLSEEVFDFSSGQMTKV